MRRRETLDRTLVFFSANCGYTSIEVSVFQTTKTVFEKERSMLTFSKKNRDHIGGGYGGLMVTKA